MTTAAPDHEIQILDWTRRVAIDAEVIEAYGKHVRKMSRDGALNAHKAVVEAIERLQAFAQMLKARVDS